MKTPIILLASCAILCGCADIPSSLAKYIPDGTSKTVTVTAPYTKLTATDVTKIGGTVTAGSYDLIITSSAGHVTEIAVTGYTASASR